MFSHHQLSGDVDLKTKTECLNSRSWRIYFSGRLDADSADAARETLSAIPDDAEKIAIDCEELEYTSLTGLRQLLIIRRHFQEADIRLENVQPCVMKALESTGFRRLFEVSSASSVSPFVRLSFRDFLINKCCESGDSIAVISEFGRHTWNEIDACSDIIAADLAMCGIHRNRCKGC